MFTSEITVEVVGQYGTDLDIARAAWVSSGNDAENPDEKRLAGVIRSLLRDKHGTPFESGYLAVRVYAPAAVRNEHVRHRIGSYSSESARYRTLAPVYYVPPPERPLKKAAGFKQMRPRYEPLSEDEYNAYRAMLQSFYWEAWGWAQRIAAYGIDSTEAVRWLNPDGQMVAYVARFNPRTVMAFLSLRTHDKAANHVSYPMWEIERVARLIEAKFARFWPITYAAFCEFGREAP